LDRRARAIASVIALLGAVERGLLVAAALLVARDEGTRSAALAGALAATWIVRGGLRGWLRVRMQARLHRSVATAALSADPLGTAIGDADPEVVLLDGANNGAELVSGAIPGAIGDAMAVIGIGVFAIATQPAYLVALGALVLAVAAAAGGLAARLTAKQQDLAWDAYRPLLDRMLFVLRGRQEIVANGAGERLSRDIDLLLARFQTATIRAHRLSAAAGRAPIVGAAIAILVVLAASPRGLASSGAALGDALVVASVVPAFVGLSSSVHAAWKATLAFRPLAALLSVPPEVRGGTEPPPSDLGKIVLSDVAFRYPGSTRDAVSNVSLSFGTGSPVVLCGPNGSGKSTVLRLLASLCKPSEGTITVDGVELAKIDSQAWRRRVAYVSQQPHLPEAWTVLETARIFAPDVDAERVRSTIERVGLLDVLEAKNRTDPLGIRVGELSVGQRKRLVLARVLLADADVFLLDEPDASLDADGVAMVARLLDELAADHLVAVAAHSPPIVAGRGVRVDLAA
jgi:ATP-binding cassette subfamily C protein CydD